ncbi:hypothetical protein [Leptospira kirschneri]|uniref:Uncharacterized protein n=1 Tax=Leptospira kirschneri serovar Bulgarica str. Nikolaevo TaxID=1240687 RepID=M6F588_9LEPT|nr:hypothetical protein [Leptospira kirschneri]EMK21144.1 hypothetical protein LEP1GSC008_2520 [Leptospira kirschneri serovar Bulgarica str. Nikolaevo]
MRPALSIKLKYLGIALKNGAILRTGLFVNHKKLTYFFKNLE